MPTTVTQCVKTKPARIKNKDYGGNAKVNDMRFTLTLTLSDQTTKKIHATVSYNKHCLASYRDNDGWNPQLGNATLHTFCGVDLCTFQKAFDDFGDLLCHRLPGVEYETFNPETQIPAQGTASGIYFKTDTNKLTKPSFHCFPVVPTGTAGGPNTWSLSGPDAACVIRLARLLWSEGERAYDAQKIAQGQAGFGKKITQLETVLASGKVKPENEAGMREEIFRLKHPLTSTQITPSDREVQQRTQNEKVRVQADYDQVKNQVWFIGLLGPALHGALKMRLKQMGVTV